MSKEKKSERWVLQQQMRVHRENQPIYYSVENNDNDFMVHWTQDVDKAKVFMTKYAAQEYDKERVIDARIAKVKVDIKAHRAYVQQCKDRIEALKRWKLEEGQRIREQQEQWDKDNAAELERVKNLACPVCKTGKPTHFYQSHSNGVLGPGHFARAIADYYICNGCGVHFTDVHKKTIGDRPKSSPL